MTGSKLKIDIRRKKILEQLRLEEKVSVTQLSQLLGVTPVTIRSDLAVLEQEGLLMRVQGGAVRLLEKPRQYTLSSQEQDVLTEQKRAIGTAVARLIQDGDTLFINSGTTCECVADALCARRSLNVVTNSVRVAAKLGLVPSIRVLLVGGEINSQYGFTHGSDAQEQLGCYQADWAILSIDGISAQGGVTTRHAEEIIVDRMMTAGAKHTLIVADRSKIGKAGFSRVCPCGEGMTLVTNRGGDDQALIRLAERGVQITCV